MDIAGQLARARREASLAYEFVPNSYTHSALNAIIAAEQNVPALRRWEEIVHRMPAETEY